MQAPGANHFQYIKSISLTGASSGSADASNHQNGQQQQQKNNRIKPVIPPGDKNNKKSSYLKSKVNKLLICILNYIFAFMYPTLWHFRRKMLENSRDVKRIK